jgi:predicted kinase
MLYIFSGLPGTGKSALSRHLARTRHAVYLRIDTVEQALRAGECQIHGPEGYMVAYAVAADNLRLGLSVVADSVNPLALTRAAWRNVAVEAAAPCVEIEVICSDAAEHRRRVETRAADIAGFALPTWDDVVRREYEPWDTPRVVVDTAGRTVAESIAALARALALP